MLTEQTVFDLLKTRCRQAAEHCENLGKFPAQGPSYIGLRACLKEIEGCCRQVAYLRADTRWLPLGLKMEQAHQKAGDWVRRKVARRMFSVLAAQLRFMAEQCRKLETEATGRVGTILPEVQAAPRRDTVPVGYTPPPKSSGGIILPDGYEPGNLATMH